MQPVRGWLRRLGEELVPLQRARGGPIVAVQLENEYGAFGSDREYLSALRQALAGAGFSDSPFFTIDQPGDLAAGCLPDVPIATTFAPGDPGANLAGIHAIRPEAPLLCGEYWAGWFDHWGEPHARSEDEQQVADLEWMLGQGASVNIYMLHGGTNFGFWNGANSGKDAPYQPTTTSYDYCAAIDEAGRPTAKFHGFRAAIERITGRSAPAVPASEPSVAIPEFALNECAPLEPALRDPRHALRPLTMERLEHPFGYVLYRAHVSGPFEGLLAIDELRDYAVVMIDGRPVARLDRRLGESSARVSFSGAATLDILVENCGRINYGPDLANERKGITRAVRLDGGEVLGWQMYAIPVHSPGVLAFGAQRAGGPAFYRGAFVLDSPADTFLDVRDLGKGTLWVNGRCAGRYWDIGPQYTLYVPAPWLRVGVNEIVAFELHERASWPRLKGRRDPIFER
jgi:beta-galactosidase